MRHLAIPLGILAACMVFGLAYGQGPLAAEPDSKGSIWVLVSFEDGPRTMRFNGWK